MKENIPLKLLKNKNKDKNIITTEEDQLLLLLHDKLGKKHINIPNDESIKLLLQNEDVKNLVKYTLNKHSEINREVEMRKKINFYYVNNKKIDDYLKLKDVQKEKKRKIEELKNKLKAIKEQRNSYILKNEEMIKEINEENKKEKLNKVKLKILNNSSNSMIMDIQNEYKKYSYLNGYKYSHLYPKKKIGSTIENENEEKESENTQKENENFNKITNIENNNIIKKETEKEKEKDNMINNDNNKNEEEHISFINISNDISNINDSKINQIINLPKLTEEEIMTYTKYSQKLFFEKINKELKEIKNSFSEKDKNKNKAEEQKSIISITTNSENDKLQKSKEIIAVENKAKQKIKNKDEEKYYTNFFREISNNYKNDIQKEEFNVSKNYINKAIEEKNDITYNQALDELNSNKKEKKINKDIWQKISDITKVKLIKDINDKYINDKNINLIKIKEIIIPKCVIEKNPQDTLNFYRNVINTYKKYKSRTDNFINKRLFPCLLQLDEKYTDFMTCLINEYDYFIKLKFENMKEDNRYSLKKFKYNLNLLRKNGIKNKYDLFGSYISNIYMKNIISINDKLLNEFNKGKSIEIYLKNIKKNKDVKNSVIKYINNTNFEEDLNLYFDQNELYSIYQYIKEFFNIEFIQNLNPFNP